MQLNFATALAELGQDAAFTFANGVRPPAWYKFNEFLPEMNEPTYTIDSGSMTIRSAMAGLTGMDSPYPPTGVSEVSTFLEETAKLANDVTLTEQATRRMQIILRGMGKPDGIDFIVSEVLNFLEKVIIQSHVDAMEWLRAQALLNGAIDWTFNDQNLVIDYGVPAGNILTTRTSTAAWDSTASEFWTDVRLLQSVLQYNIRALIVHPKTLTSIIDNDVNKIEMVAYSDLGNGQQSYTFRRLIGTNERLDSDFRSTIEVIAYGLEGEILDVANPGKTILVPFMQEGKMLAVSNAARTGYRVGEGSTDDPRLNASLGYTHIAPTVEGQGQMGRWARLYTPEDMPMQLRGQGVTNGLPVIEVPEKIAIASSDLT